MHSAIPHHHQVGAFDPYHIAHHSEHDDTDVNFFGHAFSHLQHEQSSTFLYEAAGTEVWCNKVNFDKNVLFVVQSIVRLPDALSAINPEVSPVHFTSFCYTVTYCLRGPPLWLV